jgi:hypothetical protein
MKTGYYSVLATDRHGCESTDTIKVQLQPIPEIDLGKDTAICKGATKTIELKPGFKTYLWDNGDTVGTRNIDKTGNYWLKVANTEGCTAIDSLLLTVNPLPEFDLGDDIELPASDILRLSPVLKEGIYDYLWSNGYTGSELRLPMKLFMSPTVISLCVTDQNHCNFTDHVRVNINGENASVNSDNSYYNLLKLYPNPSKGIVYISSTFTIQPDQIDIYTMSGTLVKSIKASKFYPMQVDLDGLARGIYMIRVSDEERVKELKVVLE